MLKYCLIVVVVFSLLIVVLLASYLLEDDFNLSGGFWLVPCLTLSQVRRHMQKLAQTFRLDFVKLFSQFANFQAMAVKIRKTMNEKDTALVDLKVFWQ